MSFRQCIQSLDDAIACVLRSKAEGSEHAQWVREYADNHRYRLAFDLDLVQRYAVAGTRILEFGSSPFFMAVALKRAGYEVCGLDLAPERYSNILGDHALDIRKVDFEREPVPLPDEAVDLVLFNEVFEHLRIDLIFTMTEVCRVLKTGGILLLSTPNHRSLLGIWTLLRHHSGCHVCPDLYEEQSKLTRLGYMGHVREYTAREVTGFLSRVGLHVRSVIYRYYRPRARTSLAMRFRDALERTVGTVIPASRPLFTLVCERR